MEPIALTERLGRWSSGRGPLYQLLATRIRALIDEGALPAGTGLPPDRTLAAALAVGRGTVVAAYDELVTQGRIARRQGSGTRVTGPARLRPTTGAPTFLHLLEPDDGVIMLACAAPDRPPPELVQAYAAATSQLVTINGDIGYHPSGVKQLRTAVAGHYERRGLRTTPDQIMVTSGGQQALTLLARALLNPGDRVLVETPTYPGALEAFREEGAAVRGLPIGLRGFAGSTEKYKPAAAYLISTCHNPTGSVLPAPRRRRLAEAAAASGVRLIDDEVLAGLTFPGEPEQPPLATFSDRVITIGSLSKTVWGGLRVGWIRAPEADVARLARLRAVHDLGGNVPAQLAAARLVTSHKARGARERHDQLRQELAARLPDWYAPAAHGGQTLWVRLPHGDGATFAQLAFRYGVAVLPGIGFDANGGSRDHLRLHFVASPADLTEGVRRLSSAWHAYRHE